MSGMEHRAPDISLIIPHLLMGSQPTEETYKQLEDDGVKLIINTRVFPDNSRKTPIPVKNFRAIDAPFFPIPIKDLFAGAKSAVKLINSGQSVFVHCRYGVHRSALMAAAILIALGYSSRDAINMIKKGRGKANPNIFYIKRRIKQFETAWKKEHYLRH